MILKSNRSLTHYDALKMRASCQAEKYFPSSLWETCKDELIHNVSERYEIFDFDLEIFFTILGR